MWGSFNKVIHVRGFTQVNRFAMCTLYKSVISVATPIQHSENLKKLFLHLKQKSMVVRLDFSISQYNPLLVTSS